jgi:hypothetical protein
VSGIAAEWADANVTLTLAPADPGEDAVVPISRPCPAGTIASCGVVPDAVGEACRCRYPVWELRYAGHLQRTYGENLAATCGAPSAPRMANRCLSYARYREVFEEGQAELRNLVGVGDYLVAADLIGAFIDRNAPAP